MKIAVTGHRPNKLNFEYDLSGPVSQWIRKKIIQYIRENKPSEMITGMALGVDQLFAVIAIDEGIKVHAAIPCLNQECKWPKKSKDLYNHILNNKLVEKYYVSDKSYTFDCMQNRNVYMVDRCDQLIAVWNGTSGGTANCVEYAEKANKPIIRINPAECADVNV